MMLCLKHFNFLYWFSNSNQTDCVYYNRSNILTIAIETVFPFSLQNFHNFLFMCIHMHTQSSVYTFSYTNNNNKNENKKKVFTRKIYRSNLEHMKKNKKIRKKFCFYFPHFHILYITLLLLCISSVFLFFYMFLYGTWWWVTRINGAMRTNSRETIFHFRFTF
jgi:hypothetical protein